MTFHEKLSRLTEYSNRKKLSERVGLPLNAISDCLAKQYTPRADNAMRMAKAVGVSLDWLVDDSKEWPPVRIEEACTAA